MVKIQNDPICAKIVSIVYASFVLAGYVIFFYCTTPVAPTGDKHPSYMWYKFKMVRSRPKWCQSFVLAGCVIFFRFSPSTAPPLVYIMEIKNEGIGAKMVSVVCASFMLVFAVIFFICATPNLKKASKTPCICRLKIQNCPVGAKILINF